jgi:hypothetical protein
LAKNRASLLMGRWVSGIAIQMRLACPAWRPTTSQNSHPDWFFEIKWDGFRSLAYLEDGYCRLISRNESESKSVAWDQIMQPMLTVCQGQVAQVLDIAEEEIKGVVARFASAKQ